jgi:AhpD family alkylhydroperoxidase
MMLDWDGYRQELLTRIRDLGKLTPATVRGYRELSDAGSKTAHLDPKTRELIAIAVGVTRQCDGCITTHVHAARQKGATAGEIAEALGGDRGQRRSGARLFGSCDGRVSGGGRAVVSMDNDTARDVSAGAGAVHWIGGASATRSHSESTRTWRRRAPATPPGARALSAMPSALREGSDHWRGSFRNRFWLSHCEDRRKSTDRQRPRSTSAASVSRG